MHVLATATSKSLLSRYLRKNSYTYYTKHVSKDGKRENETTLV